jgi:hypothetical protein
LNITEFAMAAVRIQWEAIDAMRALNLPEPKKPAEIVSAERMQQLRRERWLAKHCRPMRPEPPRVA